MLDTVRTGAAGADDTDAGTEKPAAKGRKFGWFWPLWLAATGMASVLLLALRGCWHRRMSWPVCVQGYSYQVCLGCGVKRLFDERRFCSYGPYRYDLSELIAWVKRQSGEMVDPHAHRSAS